MRYLMLAVAAALLVLTAGIAADQGPKAPPPNPNIDMDGYLRVAAEAAVYRQTHRLTEEDFLKMAGEEGTIILDARSKEKYDLLHVKGAINLSFPDIDVESLKRVLPDKKARILIYCNNNFKDVVVPAAPGQPGAGQPGARNPAAGPGGRPFATKAPVASLNISTYIALYSYGYRNIYELGPQLDPKDCKLPLEPTAAKQ